MGQKELDRKLMFEALVEAKKAYLKGQIPIGAALVIEDRIVDVNSNSQFKNKNWFYHAENILIQRNGKRIEEARKIDKNVELYTTMEPCLMCLGAMAQSRLSRIIYACPDPIAGSSHLEPPTSWYRENWPTIEQGPYKKESYEIFMKHIEKNLKEWESVIDTYREFGKNL